MTGAVFLLDSLDAVKLNFAAGSQLALNICLAFIMFGVALRLRLTHFGGLFRFPRKFATGVISQFVLLPALTFLLIMIIQPMPSIALGMMLVAACPGGNVSNFISTLGRGNIALSVGLTAFATVAAIFLTPLNFSLYAHLYAPASDLMNTIELRPGRMISTVMLILGLPLVAGMIFNRKFPSLTSRIIRPINILSILIFAAFIVIAFANNFSIFTGFIHRVFGIVLLHNAIALSVGWMAARVMRLEEADRRSLAIETGIQNSGLALVLTFNFFDGLGGMAMIAAWWGIWHLLAGLMLAAFWYKRPIR